MMTKALRTQAERLTDWQRVALLCPRTRAERRAWPRQIRGVFAKAEKLPIRLLKGQRFVALTRQTPHQH